MNLELEFNRIVSQETADLVNHYCALANIKDAQQMSEISMGVRRAFRLAMYRAALVTVEQWIQSTERD